MKIEELKQLLEKATKGTWEVNTSHYKNIEIYNHIGTLVVSRIARRERLPQDDDGIFSKTETANAQLIALSPQLAEMVVQMYEALKIIDSKRDQSKETDDLFEVLQAIYIHGKSALESFDKLEIKNYENNNRKNK